MPLFAYLYSAHICNENGLNKQHRNSRTRIRGLLFSDELVGRHKERQYGGYVRARSQRTQQCSSGQILNITVE